MVGGCIVCVQSNATNATAAEDDGYGEEEAAGEEEEAAAEEAAPAHLAAAHRVQHLAQKIPVAKVVGTVVKKAAAPVGKQSPLQIKASKVAAKGGKNKGGKAKVMAPLNPMPAMPTAHVLAPRNEQPLQAFAMPVANAAAAVARGQVPKAVAAMTQQALRPLPKMAASHAASAIKQSPVAARVGPAAMEPVQAVAQPMTAAVAAEKPVQAIAQPVKQMAPAA